METSEPNIYTVTQVLRGFSNEVTVQKLAGWLHVSYSTLNRCKNGSCPPSITFRALKETFDECKERYFDGDERLVTEAVLEHLRRMGYATDALDREYAASGYDGFVNMLLSEALANSGRRDGAPAKRNLGAGNQATTTTGPPEHAEETGVAGTASADEDEAGGGWHKGAPTPVDPSGSSEGDTAIAFEQGGFAAERTQPLRSGNARAASDSPNKTAFAPDTAVRPADTVRPVGGIVHGMAGWIPIIALVAVGLLQIPLDRLLGWIAGNMALFVAISLTLAAAPTICGFAIDAPVAWHRYKKRHADAAFTWQNWREVAKYGDPVDVVAEEGRFNAAGDHTAFALFSNVAGAFCAISLIAFLAPLPGFLDYFAEHNWTEYFKAAMVLAFFIAYHHTASQQSLPRPTEHGREYNPDNYLYTRVHVWANILHLVWVITLSAIFALCMLGYSAANFQRFDLPLTVLWPVAQTVLFLAYANISPYAVSVKVSSVGSFASSLVAMAVCMVGMIVCFKPSWTSIVGVAVYVALALAAFTWRKRMAEYPEAAAWLERSAGSRVYGILMAAVIVGLAAISLATQAIV